MAEQEQRPPDEARVQGDEPELHAARGEQRMVADAVAPVPFYIPSGKLDRHGGPKSTKTWDLINKRKLRAIRTPWGVMVEGRSFVELMQSMPPAVEPKECDHE